MMAVQGKLENFEEPQSEGRNLRKLKQSKIFKLSLLIALALLILVGTVLVLIYFLNEPEECSKFGLPQNDEYIGSHQVFNRTKWHGRPPLRYKNITSPVPLVVIKHTGGGQCYNFQVCAEKLQTIQSQAMSIGFPDIYFNFLIGGDENIYVGRGWDVYPQQREGIIDIVFMGSYAFDKLTEGMIDAALELIRDGLENSKLSKNYKVVCDNQTQVTGGPGPNVYKEVKKWPHYDPGLYFVKKSVMP